MEEINREYEQEKSFLETSWLPISEYVAKSENGVQRGPVVLRWHKAWKVAIPVFYRPGLSNTVNCEWVDAARSNTWPEEAFEPFFSNDLPQSPV